MNHHAPRSDFGPRAPLARGERVRETAPDIDRPNASVDRARRFCAIRAMAAAVPLPRDASNEAEAERRRAALDAWQARIVALETYSRACEIVAGARDGKPDAVPEVRVSSSPRGVPDVALEAAEIVRRSTQAMGLTGTAVINALALRSGTLRDAARITGCPERSVGAYVVSTLDRLAEVV